MANPAFITCPKDTWQKVATNVTAGRIWKFDYDPNTYLHTYRVTGDPAPTDQTEGAPIFVNGLTEEISSSSGIDVYILCPHEKVKVRVDL